MVIPKVHYNNKSSMIQVMAWCCIGSKPLSEPMMLKFTDAQTGLTVFMSHPHPQPPPPMKLINLLPPNNAFTQTLI